jgi:methylglutaconyl-CoA hydratase
MTGLSDLLVESRSGLVQVTLNRPDRRNAFDARMAGELLQVFGALAQDRSVRGVLLRGSGSAFCAGADLGWMNGGRSLTEAQARAEAEQLIMMYRSIDECPCPVIARVQGPAFGGGVGLVAACDVAVADQGAIFALSEARMGLVPAVIAPFVLRKTGASFVRRFSLTGEPFSASIALQSQLVHEVVPRDRLDSRIAELLRAVTGLAPQAARHTKALLRRLSPALEVDHELWTLCADANVRARLSAEAKEGLQAFLNKRAPAWEAVGAAEEPQAT